MKLGIIVVYLFDTSTSFLLDLHLSNIRKFTSSPYKIYGAAERLDQKGREQLSNYSEIQLCKITTTKLRGNDEHAYYLEQLTEIAFQDGATHVVSHHLDSFPVYNGWETILEEITNQSGTCVAAEGAFTACLFFSKDFYFRYHPPFRFRNKVRGYSKFLKKYRLDDHSGTSFLYTCYQHHLDWHILKKTSQKTSIGFGDLCGGLIFHLGGAIRLSFQQNPPSPLHSTLLQLLQVIRKIPLLRMLYFLSRKSLPKKQAYHLQKWLFNQIDQAEAIKKNIEKSKLQDQIHSCQFDIISSIEEVTHSILRYHHGEKKSINTRY